MKTTIFLLINNFIIKPKVQQWELKYALYATYATLVLGFLEEKLYRTLEHQKGIAFANFVRDQWRRYLDDCFIFWQRSMDDLVYFYRTLNSLHNDIVFKMQTSKYQLPFLDVMVIKINTSVSTDIYFTSTDSKQYLNFKPCHPKHTKINIPFSLARRICTIVSDISVRNVRLKELASSLIDRKYPIQVVKTGFLKALQIPRSSLLTVKEETVKPIIPFILTHNPKNRELFGLLKSNFTILKQDEKMNKIITETKFIKCKRTAPKSQTYYYAVRV